MKAKWIPIAAATVLIAVVAAGLAFLYRTTATAPPAPNPVPAPVAEVESEAVLPAIIRARLLVKTPVPVDGRVAAFHAEVGDEVFEGQIIAEIRSEASEVARESAKLDVEQGQTRVNNLESTVTAARLEASRASADAARLRAELDRATRNYSREKLLLAEGATPRLVFEKAERDYKTLETDSATAQELSRAADERVSSLQAELDRQRKILETKLTDMEGAESRAASGQVLAPAAGVIAARRGQVGDEVHPSMEDLFQIATDLSVLDAEVEPSPAQLARIKPGQPAAVTVADLPNEALTGKVVSVQDGKAMVEFSNPSPLVRPGMTAQVRIKIQ